MKLADFGLAKHVVRPVFTVCGTPTYVAPEILSEKGRCGTLLCGTLAHLLIKVSFFNISYFIFFQYGTKIFELVLSWHLDFNGNIGSYSP